MITLNREKVAFAANKIVQNLEQNRFTSEETVALLKCLDRVTQAQCLDRDLVLVSKKLLMQVVAGEKSVNAIEGM